MEIRKNRVYISEFQIEKTDPGKKRGGELDMGN